MKSVGEGLAARGVTVVTFDFPYMERKRGGAPDPAPVLEEAFATQWRAVADAFGSSSALFAGGKSMGGRIASQVAAKRGFDPVPKGLVFFGYPLHPPGKPAQRRDRHLGDITTPMLFLQGTRDPFGSREELSDLTARLPGAALEIIEGGDHSLTSRSASSKLLDRVIELAANWVKSRA